MADTPPLAAGATAQSARRKIRARDLKAMPGFKTVGWACVFALYMPLIVLIVFSFNDNRSVVKWTEFSLRWYAAALENEGTRNAAWMSVKVAAVATFFSTIAATMAALATTRTAAFRGQGLVYGIINQPLMIPEIVTAISTLSLFSLIKQLTGITGVGYLMAAHTAFCIPFAYMPIRARLQGMDLSLEQAGADLYGTPWRVFRRVTLPQLWPGVLAGAMLAFVISLDDVVITEFVKSAGQDTLPTYMLGQLRRVVTPEVNSISTALLAISVVMVVAFFFLSRTKK